MQSLNERRRGGIPDFVADAVDTTVARSRSLLPCSIVDDLFQRHAVTRSAPCCDENLGVDPADFLRSDLPARVTQELPSCRFHQLRHPFLGSDDRLAPVFTKDAKPCRTGSTIANGIDLALHLGDEPFSPIQGS